MLCTVVCNEAKFYYLFQAGKLSLRRFSNLSANVAATCLYYQHISVLQLRKFQVFVNADNY